MCDLIAEFVGNTFIAFRLIVYYDKNKRKNWHAQDGEAWVYCRDRDSNKLIDTVSFDELDKVYYVDKWPLKGMITSENPDGSVISEQKAQDLERQAVLWICSQIIHLVQLPLTTNSSETVGVKKRGK